MQKILLVFASALALLCAPAAFAERHFPDQALRGDMTAYQYPAMKIGDLVYRLSPGSRIYNEQNLIVMPASIQVQKAAIIYTLDMQGNLLQVWLLTAEEATRYPMPAKPAPPGNK